MTVGTEKSCAEQGISNEPARSRRVGVDPPTSGSSDASWMKPGEFAETTSGTSADLHMAGVSFVAGHGPCDRGVGLEVDPYRRVGCGAIFPPGSPRSCRLRPKKRRSAQTGEQIILGFGACNR